MEPADQTSGEASINKLTKYHCIIEVIAKRREARGASRDSTAYDPSPDAPPEASMTMNDIPKRPNHEHPRQYQRTIIPGLLVDLTLVNYGKYFVKWVYGGEYFWIGKDDWFDDNVVPGERDPRQIIELTVDDPLVCGGPGLHVVVEDMFGKFEVVWECDGKVESRLVGRRLR